MTQDERWQMKIKMAAGGGGYGWAQGGEEVVGREGNRVTNCREVLII